jgi:hypothetical protein
LQYSVEKHSLALKCVSFILGQLVRNSFLFAMLPKLAAAYGTISYQHLPGDKLIEHSNLHNTKTGFLCTFPLLQEPLHSTSCALLTDARPTG